MNAIVIEHVPVAELPETWQTKLALIHSDWVTVRIEEEAPAPPSTACSSHDIDDPAFGIWRDREDISDPASYVREIRQPRYRRDGSRNED